MRTDIDLDLACSLIELLLLGGHSEVHPLSG
jgi:hypothetical protein